MNKIVKILLFNFVLLILFVEPLSAQIQINIYPQKDAAVSSVNPNSNMGSDTVLSIAVSSQNESAVSYIYFDLSSIPPNATINSAFLALYCYGRTNYPVPSVGGGVFASWSESGITWNNKPGYSSTYSNGDSLNINSYNEYNVSRLISNWYSGTYIDNGFILQNGTISESSASFSSREGSYPPMLIVNFSILPSSPEPYLPVNASINNPINPILVWKSSEYADSYQLDVSTNSNFSLVVFSQAGIKDTSMQITNLKQGTKYFWRVNASNSSGFSSYSSTWSFTTVAERTLTVSSFNPNNGVNISVSPLDNNNQGNGTTQFTRLYNNGASVNLTALSTANGNNFQKWQRNGSDYSNNQNISFVMDTNYIFTAVYQTPTSVAIDNGNLVTKYMLYQNFPNPFNPMTEIRFSIPKESYVRLDIFNSLGLKIKELINQELSTGYYSVNFDATNLPSAIYYYRLIAGEYIEIKKAILLK